MAETVVLDRYAARVLFAYCDKELRRMERRALAGKEIPTARFDALVRAAEALLPLTEPDEASTP